MFPRRNPQCNFFLHFFNHFKNQKNLFHFNIQEVVANPYWLLLYTTKTLATMIL
ncbi:hypothetical protein GGR09_000572 [Bartonella heixiaziensis]